MTDAARKETETAGEFGEQVIAHGKTAGGVYKPIYITDDGKVKIDPVPASVTDIVDAVWDELQTDHVTANTFGKRIQEIKDVVDAIPTTPMRGTDNAFLATDGANLPNDADIGDLPWDELYAGHGGEGSMGNYLANASLKSGYNYMFLSDGDYGLSALKDLIDAIPTVMVGTNNAALATVLEDAMQKATTPAYNQDTDSLEALREAIDLIPTVMVGTNNAALASVCLEARLGELDAANLPADVAAIPTVMVGTNNAALASTVTTRFNTLDDYVDEIETMLKHATYGLSALNIKILNITNKDATPYPQTYPKLAGSVTVPTGTGVWTAGAWTQIVPVNTITSTFWLVGVWWQPLVEEAVLMIGTGTSGSEVEVANLPNKIYLLTAVGGISIRPTYMSCKIKVDANTRIAARVADSKSAAQNHKVKVLYLTGL